MLTPKEHLARADQYLQRAVALRAQCGLPVEEIPDCGVLAALALAHATTASAQLMASGVAA